MKYTIPALLAAALCSTAIVAAQGQYPNPPGIPGGPAAAHKPSNPNVAGTVNGQPLTWTEVVHTLQAQSPDVLTTSIGQVVGPEVANQLFAANPKSQVTITRAQALTMLRDQPTQQVSAFVTNMLRARAVHEEAVKQHVSPTDADVQVHITKLLRDARNQGFIPNGMTDAQFLASRKISRSFLMTRVRQDMETLALVGKSLEKTNGRPYGPDDFLQARHILITVNDPSQAFTPPGSKPETPKPEDKAKADKDALAKITQIRNDIVSGKTTFDAAAKQDSQDPGTKEKGGDLGVFIRGSMVKEFDNVAFTLKPGEISQPVKTQYGYHIIQVEKLGKDIPATERQDAMERYEQQQAPQIMAAMMNSWKIVNNLQPSMPQMPGMMGMRPGMRPGAPPPGVRPGMMPPGARPGAVPPGARQPGVRPAQGGTPPPPTPPANGGNTKP